MLRWALICITSAAVLVTTEFVALRAVCGGEKQDRAREKAQQTVDRATRGRDTLGPRNTEPRNVTPRNLEPRHTEARNRNSEPQQIRFPQQDVPFKQQRSNDTQNFRNQLPVEGNQSAVRAKDKANPDFRTKRDLNLGSNSGERFRIDPKRIDSGKQDLNPTAAEAIRRSRERVETRKIEFPNNPVQKPVVDSPKINVPGPKLVLPGDTATDKLPKQAREALERANNKRSAHIDGRELPGGFVGGARGATDRKHDLPNRSNELDRRSKIDDATAARLSKQDWREKGDRARVDRIAHAPQLKSLRLDEQFRLHNRGDISRQLGLHSQLVSAGGWQHRHVGTVSPLYRNHCSYRTYYGPSWYPRHCWYPVWNSWVSWSWNFNCQPSWDPRPVLCRPVVYDPCSNWIAWNYPAWQPLPTVACGTWVDVPPVAINTGYDVQLLAVRFVDPGHYEQNLGQRYRIWVRNNSLADINQPFNVVLMGTNETVPTDRRLEVGQRVPELAAGQTLALELRLPLTPNNVPGAPFEFSNVHVLVDSHRELNDADLANNGAVLNRGDILPVDPAVFSADANLLEPGAVINIAGEGLGPEPGQVMLYVNGETVQPEIIGWYDLGVQVRMPAMSAHDLWGADVVIVRGDGAAANPLALQIAAANAGQDF